MYFVDSIVIFTQDHIMGHPISNYNNKFLDGYCSVLVLLYDNINESYAILKHKIIVFKNEVFLQLGSVRPSVRPYVRTRVLGPVVNFGILELTYRLQTFRDYSYSS